MLLDLLRDLGLTFVPIFVAMDVVGVLPIMTALTEGMTKGEFERMTRFAILSALGLGLVFVALGNAIFALMGIEIRDFLIAGGLILFLISAKDLITGKAVDTEKGESSLVGAVPIGIPLIVGPGVLTSILLLTGQYPVWMVLVSFILNLVIAWVTMTQMRRIMRFLGQSGAKVTSKVAALLLAAIAVKMIRQGILGG
jgi:multiple antibiotic resistance protein